MSFRFVKVSSLYPGAIAHFESRRTFPGKDAPYSVLYGDLCSQSYFWSNHYETHLRKLGVDAHEVFSNVPSLQKAWARENAPKARSREDIVFRQLLALRPDVVFFQDNASFPKKWLQALRAALPSLKLLLGWRCAPFAEAELDLFSEYDATLTCNPLLKKDFELRGLRSEVLHHAFDPLTRDRVLRSPPSAHARDLASSVLFAGSLVQAKSFHLGRGEFLLDLAKRGVPLRLFADKDPLVKRLAKRLLGESEPLLRKTRLASIGPAQRLLRKAPAWKDTRVFSADERILAGRVNPPAYGIEFLRLIHESPVCLNFHIDSSGSCAGNARLFEATGMGSCLITDWKENLSDFFEEGSEIVAFKNAEECAEKITWLLEHPEEREAIAKAGQAKCFKAHSFELRAKQLLDWIQRQLSSKPTPGMITSGHSSASNSRERMPHSTATALQPIA